MTNNLQKISWLILAKAGMIGSAFLAYNYHSDLKKLEYSLFEKNLPIAENAYNSPPVLEVDWQINDEGMIETYLVNSETGKKVEILYDMLPRNSTMIEAMVKRSAYGIFEIGLPQPANLEARLYQTEVRK